MPEVRLLEAIIAHPAIAQAQTTMYPVFDRDGRARCSRCSGALSEAYVQVHQCKGRGSVKVKVRSQHAWRGGARMQGQRPCNHSAATDTTPHTTPRQCMPPGGRCPLCSRLTQEGQEHACSALSRMGVDMSALPKYATGWTQEPLTTARDVPGHWVTVYLDRRGQHRRHHLIISPSDVGGFGAFTASGLVPVAQPRAGRDATPAAQQEAPPRVHPTEDHAAVGRYTGLLRDGPLLNDEDGRLAALTLHNGRTIDPNAFGGVLVRINAAHGSAANLCLEKADSPATLMLAATPASIGQELRWDYRAVTDDPNDPLNAACNCGGKQCRYKEISMTGRRCTGKLMRVAKTIK